MTNQDIAFVTVCGMCVIAIIYLCLAWKELDEYRRRAVRAELEVRRLNQELPHNDIGEAAMDYLARNGISGEILRGWAAPAVPEEWREVLSGLLAIAEKKGKKQGSPNHSHLRPGIWDDDNGPALSGKPCAECAMYDKARALLQSSAPATEPKP